jgi:hypothetical protein
MVHLPAAKAIPGDIAINPDFIAPCPDVVDAMGPLIKKSSPHPESGTVVAVLCV